MSHWKDVPEIEPLSDTTWRRIERSVFAELDRNPGYEKAESSAPPWLFRWRRPLIGLGLGLAAAAVLLLVLRMPPAGETPQVYYVATKEAPVELMVGRAAIRVAPASIVSIQSSSDHAVLMLLEQGRVECAVAHDEHQPPLVVQAGDVRVEVVGTSFAVTREGGSAMVEVQEGVVKVFHGGKRALVSGGERWTRAGTRPIPASAPAAAGSQTGAVAAATQESPRPTVGAGTETGRAAEIETGHATEIEGEREAGHEAHAMELKRRYEKAAGLEATDPAAAIEIYRELARGKSPWAANALFAQARLELDRGHRAEAVRLLQLYLRRYPDGYNAIDARALLETAERAPSGR
jgi:hypothetical protein